ncbi:hypothetical protein A9798_01440 [Edwardsiella hoshinae]|uniref:Protein of uncharacterized function (DUF1488) n=1 Tax=Edwardsiella hoshinae TaxID=93378 RepID=A0A376D697_9GAMM|nr:DUF1488 domain-containing protein [Edwardsiella hoshinae]AOV95748.1 hypothetical protein A9798_01440 [Edwardsiella hoshinae]QPR28405.1 DUF1488 domain-containing protein [Edwardsiella hoshinae]STC83469.1 Protein of uncharacterised function (DUF1488) [Edwardsiella hoshinae]
MNQTILFPELERWQASLAAVTFPAMVGGFQVTCAIRLVDLRRLANQAGLDMQLAPLAWFAALRWQLEEEAEQAIAQEAYDAQGWVWIAG